MRSVTTALKVVEEVREEVQEIKDEENGGLKVEEKRSLHAWMRGHAQHLSHAVQCESMTTRT